MLKPPATSTIHVCQYSSYILDLFAADLTEEGRELSLDIAKIIRAEQVRQKSAEQNLLIRLKETLDFPANDISVMTGTQKVL